MKTLLKPFFFYETKNVPARRYIFCFVLLYLFVGLASLFLTSAFINRIDSNNPGINLRFLHHYKYILFVMVTGTALYFLLRAHHKHLSMAEDNYYKLFEGSPGATYVMDKNTLKFLAVNDVMVKKYGYDRDQLLKMTALDIRPENEKTRLKDYIYSDHDEGHETGIWQHQKKNGEIFYVLISHHSIKFQDTEAYIVIAIDIDRSVRNEKRLREITWSNSHEIRKPVSNILGLIYLLKENNRDESADAEMIDLLAVSANELDQVIKKISLSAAELDKKC